MVIFGRMCTDLTNFGTFATYLSVSDFNATLFDRFVLDLGDMTWL
jgi:hypothetical protein